LKLKEESGSSIFNQDQQGMRVYPKVSGLSP